VQVVNMLEQAEPGRLAHFRSVGVTEPVRSGDRPDQAGIGLDEAIPTRGARGSPAGGSIVSAMSCPPWVEMNGQGTFGAGRCSAAARALRRRCSRARRHAGTCRQRPPGRPPRADAQARGMTRIAGDGPQRPLRRRSGGRGGASRPLRGQRLGSTVGRGGVGPRPTELRL
jgi:hypothetical protein